MNEQLQRIVEIICLVYHEARNIRHPIDADKLQCDPRYRALRNLPRNKCKAWTEMTNRREKAALTGSARGAADEFERFFVLSLDELHELYRCPFWRDSDRGGNQWAGISRRVKELVEMADDAEGACVAATIEEILGMCHNTGKVGVKLQELGTARGKL